MCGCLVQEQKKEAIKLNFKSTTNSRYYFIHPGSKNHYGVQFTRILIGLESNFLLSIDAAVTLQPSMCQRNPAYIQLGPVKSSQTALVSGSYSENPAYNIDVQQSSHQEPTYEVIPSHTDGTPHITQGIQNIIYNQNPAYIHLSIHAEESASVQADPMSPADYSQNPAYGLWHFKS